MEQKYQIGTNSGTLRWNIENMKKDLTSYQLKKYDTQKLFHENPFHGDKTYAMCTDTSIPLIVVELMKGKEKLIDGNHRLYKAMKLGKKAIYAFYLKRQEHIKYIENYDEDLYDKIVQEFS